MYCIILYMYVLLYCIVYKCISIDCVYVLLYCIVYNMYMYIYYIVCMFMYAPVWKNGFAEHWS